MSDYDWCEKHKIAFLMPELICCPRCWLEDLRKIVDEQELDPYFFDSEMINEIDRLIKEWVSKCGEPDE